MPTHITVNGLGLTHKSSTGFSKATIPDVCKTPTPGGPVPMPYPNFALSGTLTNGTTTVFAKGGKMIAIKGSQYSTSTGDEPGTVGGVKSNTFKQATDWITYSFDVKMDGKNACRDTDKKFHNNKNTVDLMGNVNPNSPGRPNILTIPCDNAPEKPSPGRHKFTDCEKEEICAKIADINKEMKGTLRSAITSYDSLREQGNARAAQLRGMAMRESNNPELQALNQKGFKHLSKKCQKELQDKASNSKPPYKGFSVDHVKEIQFCGHPTDLNNLRWMSRRPNRWIGGQLNQLVTSGPKKHTGVKGDCC
ncbi:DUF4150 domain-containing protein [Mesorhizobium sp. L-8-3]|uniref:DUF4150 domain-containing protein n=1 Tax=Mesorhizobium sp. L-8-3 TaxID=2744522 RepID=UPI0019372D23|nr:DUF4150 domain-containing protein [Mesorhizobium sp. L-8-3]BCH25437.1 hypothetical protein MesoLjLb_52220 [Mesorhizobium sp. L-8-3]